MLPELISRFAQPLPVSIGRDADAAAKYFQPSGSTSFGAEAAKTTLCLVAAQILLPFNDRECFLLQETVQRELKLHDRNRAEFVNRNQVDYIRPISL